MLKRNENVVVCIEDAPTIPGLCFRRTVGEADVPQLGQVTRQADEVDGLDAALSVDWLERALRDGTIADPSQDLIIAEVFGEVVGFGLVTGTAGDESGQTYYLAGKVLPEWRGEGIGRALITENERRLTSHAGQNGERWPCVFETACADTQDDAVELLISLGYIPVATGPFSVGKPGLIPPAVGDKQILFRKAMR